MADSKETIPSPPLVAEDALTVAMTEFGNLQHKMTESTLADKIVDEFLPRKAAPTVPFFREHRSGEEGAAHALDLNFESPVENPTHAKALEIFLSERLQTSIEYTRVYSIYNCYKAWLKGSSRWKGLGPKELSKKDFLIALRSRLPNEQQHLVSREWAPFEVTYIFNL
jgi:hypothetical protein